MKRVLARYIPGVVLAVLLMQTSPLAGEVFQQDWGPFYSNFEDVHGTSRIQFLGPVGDLRTNPEGDIRRAMRPFYHSQYKKEDDFRRSEYLWPLGVRRTRGDRSYTRILLNFYWNWDVNNNESAWRLWMLPFYFQGRDHDGETYVALFPLLGSIHEFLFWDEINFALWPLWVQSRQDDILANTFLWPFLSKTTGPGLERFRVFPFYGYSDRQGLGRKTFVMWPFLNFVRYTIPGSSGSGWILFPITGHLKLADQETWWFIPPIFRYTLGEEQNRLFGPWPVFQREEGEVDKFYLLPFYGHKKQAGVEKWLFLWPLGQAEVAESPLETRKKLFFFPFLQRFSETPKPGFPTETGASRYLKIWPLFQHYTEQDGKVQEFRLFDFNPTRGGPVERNYAPFWQIISRSKNGDNEDTSILWGLYRSAKRGETYRYRSLFPLFSWSREEEDSGHFSILKGLLSRRKEGEDIEWRLLYLFKFGAKDSSL